MTPDPLKNKTEAQLEWDDLRSSPAFPAIVGALAGAIGSAALMLILNRLTRPKSNMPAAYDENGNPMKVVYLPPPKSFSIFGFSPSDLVTLLVVGSGLARQVAEWIQQNKEEEAAKALPPSPAELPTPPPAKAK